MVSTGRGECARRATRSVDLAQSSEKNTVTIVPMWPQLSPCAGPGGPAERCRLQPWDGGERRVHHPVGLAGGPCAHRVDDGAAWPDRGGGRAHQVELEGGQALHLFRLVAPAR